MIRFFLLLLLVGLGGATLWIVKYSPQFPQFSFAAPSVSVPNSVGQVAAETDKVVAQGIRDLAEGKWKLPELPQSGIGDASVSASVAVTPKEIWSAYRERGSQAVLDTVAQSAEVSVNTVSTKVLNEARYQYCLGVIEQYQQVQ